jgi:hypothetical protein
LFAALEVASGKVVANVSGHTHVEFITFLESLARRYTKLELHLICDNNGTHISRDQAMACRARPFSSALYADQVSWLNLVELWLALITQ